MKLVVHLCSKRGNATNVVLDVADPTLPVLLQKGDSSGGFGVSTQWILSDAEAASVSHFSVVCLQTVPESDAAYKRNHDTWAASPLIQAGAGLPIRLVRGFRMSNVKLKPKTVGGIGEWTETYVAGPEVWQAFRDAALTGIVPEEILQVRGDAPFPGVQQLFTHALLQPAEIRDSLAATPENGGLLCYHAAQLADLPDFAHTAEPWANSRFGWPLWVVSARVRELFRHQGLHGWGFLPVLTTGSALHDAYVDLYGKLRALVSATQLSKLEGRTWQEGKWAQ